jgi:hypothetical protein
MATQSLPSHDSAVSTALPLWSMISSIGSCSKRLISPQCRWRNRRRSKPSSPARGPTSSFEQHGSVSLIRAVIGELFTGSSM